MLRTVEPRAHAQRHRDLKALSGAGAPQGLLNPLGRKKRAAGREMISIALPAWPASTPQPYRSAHKGGGRPCRDASHWDVQASRRVLRGTRVTGEAVAAV